MKKSTKAVLLSALVFPGTGHVLLKKYVTGAILLGASIVSAYYIVSITVEESLRIVEQIQSGNIQLDESTIENMVSEQSGGTDARILDISTDVLIICWLIGIIDSYRLGRIRDRDDPA